MSTYTQILYHIVFSTKDREKSLLESGREELFKYIWGFIRNKNCILYRINGMEDHLHLLVALRPEMALSEFIRNLKAATTIWIKQRKLFSHFTGWQSGYGAFTYAMRDKEMIIHYIKNQQEHHKKVSFIDELRSLLDEAGIPIDERYFPER